MSDYFVEKDEYTPVVRFNVVHKNQNRIVVQVDSEDRENKIKEALKALSAECSILIAKEYR